LPDPTADELRDAAFAYARAGWAVHPLKPGEKQPLSAHGKDDATTDSAQIGRWWHEYRKANIGVRTGVGSGIVVIDVDDAHHGDQTLDRLEAEHGPLPATAVVLTGNGRHFYFAHPGVEMRNSQGELGTLATPGIDVRGDGGYVVAPPSLHPDGAAYEWLTLVDPAPLPAWIVELVRATHAPPAAPSSVPAGEYRPAAGTTAYARAALDAIAAELAGAPEGQRNATLNAACYRMGRMVGGGQIDRADVETAFTVAALAAGLDARETARTIRSGLDAGATKPLYVDRARALAQRERAEPPPDDEEFVAAGPVLRDALPTVVTKDRQLRDITTDLLGHLGDANAPPVLFVRSGMLVRVRYDEHGTPIIDAISNVVLRNRVARVCNTINLIKNGRREVPPPNETIDDLLALDDWPFPPLEAVTEIPTLRADGTIHAVPGYDEASRLLYRPDPAINIGPITDHPAPSELDDARALLVDELLGDFPFDTTADRANALALLLTPIVRPAIGSPVPLALLDSPEPGTGKGLIADVVSIVSTGRPMAAQSLSANDEEVRKVITATLTQGRTIIVFDDIKAALASPALAAALTAPTWTDRVLGRNDKVITLRNRATWIATGNNIGVAGDLARRCYRIRLDAKMARPFQRTQFRHIDLPGWVEAHRGELLHALLTLARAWWAADQPAAPVQMLGGFAPWAHTIAGILHHAGIEGFLTNQIDFMVEADTDAGEWEPFLRAWADHYGTEHITAAKLVNDLEQTSFTPAGLTETLPGALAEFLGHKRAAANIGMRLRARKGRRHGDDGIRVERVENDRSKRGAHWYVTADSRDQDGTQNGSGTVVELDQARDSRDSRDFLYTGKPGETSYDAKTPRERGEISPATPASPADTTPMQCNTCGRTFQGTGRTHTCHDCWLNRQLEEEF